MVVLVYFPPLLEHLLSELAVELALVMLEMGQLLMELSQAAVEHLATVKQITHQILMALPILEEVLVLVLQKVELLVETEAQVL
jgi:hypothetical protein